MRLVNRLNVLIAARLGKEPDEITPDFIRQRRASRRKTMRFDDANSYSGHVSDGLRHLTDDEAASAIKAFRHMTAGSRE